MYLNGDTGSRYFHSFGQACTSVNEEEKDMMSLFKYSLYHLEWF